MHPNSYRLMGELLDIHAPNLEGSLVYDVGSRDFNGSYKPIITNRGGRYVGVDVKEGKNVDIVLPFWGSWLEATDFNRASVIISGQTLEHVERPWDWIHAIRSLTFPGGTIIIIAPWRFEIHKYPLDCWRILPDGMRALLEYGTFNVIDVGISEDDCFGVAKCKEF